MLDDLSPEERGTRVPLSVLGRHLSSLQLGRGRPIIFLHGEIGAAYMWRNVLPRVAEKGRAIAIDLVGAGRSDKLARSHDGAYSFACQFRHLDGALEALGVSDDIVFVGHDWGCNLAFEWAMRNPGKVAGIAYSEPVSPPFDWDAWPQMLRPLFTKLFAPEGEAFQLQENGFVQSLSMGILRRLTDTELQHWIEPYSEPGEARRPPLDWARQVPLGGRHPEMARLIEAHHHFMATCDLPKLLIKGSPGALVFGRRYELLRRFRNQKEIEVPGIHWLAEDSPQQIGDALANWLAQLD